MKQNRRLALGVTYLDFFLLGLFLAVTGVAWPSIRATFGQPLDALGWILSAITVGSLLASSVSGRLVARVGIGHFLMLSNLVTAAGLLSFAVAPTWAWLVASSWLFGCGVGALQAGLNNAITLRFSARYVSWLHLMFAVGASLGPAILAAFLVRGRPWAGWYLLAAAAFGLVGPIFSLGAGWWPGRPAKPVEADGQASATATLRQTLRLPLTWMSISLFFMYTGVETTAGQWAFSILTEGRGVSPAAAGTAISLLWGGLALGRVFLGAASEQLNLIRLVTFSLVGVLVSSVLFALPGPGVLSVAALGLMGLALSPLYPLLMATTGQRVGPRHVDNVIGLQVSAGAIGVAALPSVAGVIAASQGLETIGPFLIAGVLVLMALFRVTNVRQRRLAA